MRREARIETARFDGVTLFLPEKIDAFPSADLNRSLYLWLAALAVAARPCEDFSADPLRRDVLRLRRIFLDCDHAVALFPGLAPIRAALAAQTLRLRPPVPAPAVEAQLEACIRARLSGDAPKAETPLERALAGEAEALAELKAPASYKTYLPVLMWGERVAPPRRAENVATTTRPSRVATPPTAKKKP